MSVVILTSDREAGRFVEIDSTSKNGKARIAILERDGWTRVKLTAAEPPKEENPKDGIDQMDREAIVEALNALNAEFDEKATLSVLRNLLRKLKASGGEPPK